jgi:hypothetical protein
MFYTSNLQYPVFKPIKVESAGKYIWLLPCPEETPFFAIGNRCINLGIFVEDILSRPNLSSNGKFVLGKFDILSANDYIKQWGKSTGNGVEVVETRIEDLEEVFRHGVGRWVPCLNIGIGGGTRPGAVKGRDLSRLRIWGLRRGWYRLKSLSSRLI